MTSSRRMRCASDRVQRNHLARKRQPRIRVFDTDRVKRARFLEWLPVDASIDHPVDPDLDFANDLIRRLIPAAQTSCSLTSFSLDDSYERIKLAQTCRFRRWRNLQASMDSTNSRRDSRAE